MVSWGTYSRQPHFPGQLESPLQCEKELLWQKQNKNSTVDSCIYYQLIWPFQLCLQPHVITLFLNGFKWQNLHAYNWSLTHITQ